MITEEIGLLARGDPGVAESPNIRQGTQVWREAAILDGESKAQDNRCVMAGWKVSTMGV